jgi:hypothetical protein
MFAKADRLFWRTAAARFVHERCLVVANRTKHQGSPNSTCYYVLYLFFLGSLSDSKKINAPAYPN